MAMWHLLFQRDAPVSIRRADGFDSKPPEGVLRYVELNFGAWTLEPETDPVGMGGVEWPRACVFKDFLRCAGTMNYVEHVPRAVVMGQTGERVYRHGWVCDTCGNQEVGGMAVAQSSYASRDYEFGSE
jgi:hypothetical protein